eukprot:CAMPEP_0114549686 /NCGR_PEP_ID=MMETSP0114-20121206/5658_1 /TAXON_ID=31324 /ORGANISM="Goniomonas sp, Strain m" /LENGTH=71 /DNA_ID=CAMNT_0001734381 /DNA_START=236 /DNA_END=451 /DNA_ORIENTATION=+
MNERSRGGIAGRAFCALCSSGSMNEPCLPIFPIAAGFGGRPSNGGGGAQSGTPCCCDTTRQSRHKSLPEAE